MKLSGNTILVTGGTSGIGRALAEVLHRRGNQVIIAGRRQALLDEMTSAHEGMHALRVDIEDARAVEAFAAEVRRQFPQLNVLINNAGISRHEDLRNAKGDIAAALAMIQTNIVGVLQLTAALLPLLERQASATIMTTTSGLAFMPRATHPTYCATKAFLHSWLQSLRRQLRETSVEVLELIPPYVQTELSGPAQLADPHAMPLADYIDEVMAALDAGKTARGEIMVARAEALRWAEKNGNYEQLFETRNG